MWRAVRNAIEEEDIVKNLITHGLKEDALLSDERLSDKVNGNFEWSWMACRELKPVAYLWERLSPGYELGQ